MKRLLIFVLASAAVLFAPAARATPPDITSVGDQLFATTPEKVFVLRGTGDNLGLYTGFHSETFLVEIDLETGGETYWLVYREHKTTVYDEPDSDGRVETELLDREDWHNPYAIVADAGASLAPSVLRGEELFRSPDRGIYIITADHFWPAIAFSRADVFAQLDRSLAGLALRVDDFERMAPISTRELYSDRVIDRDGCSLYLLFWPVGPESLAYRLIRIECDDGEGPGTISLIQAVSTDVEVSDKASAP